MDGWFDVPIVIDTQGLMVVFFLFFMFALAFLVGVTLSGGYKLNQRLITWNLAGASTAIALFGTALGIFAIAIILSPYYAWTNTGLESIDVFLTYGVVAFVVAMLTVTFLFYTKRGGF